MVNLCHSYSTRNQFNYSLSCYSSSKLQTPFIFNLIKIWNSIPISIRNLPFKRFRKEYIKFSQKTKDLAHYIADLGHIDAFFFVKRYFLIFLMFFIVVCSVVQFLSDSVLLLLFVSFNVTKQQFFIFLLFVIC